MFLRKLSIALAFAFVPMAAGCQTIADRVGQESLATADEKSLITAELAFQQIAQLIIAADTAGILTTSNKEKLLPLFNKGYVALIQARQAYDANNGVEAAMAQSNALSAIAEIVKLLQDWKILKETI